MTRLMGFVHEFADLDGDGNLEIVLLLQSKADSAPTPFELRILSFANGETVLDSSSEPGRRRSPLPS